MAKEYIERNALIAEYDRVHIGAPGGARSLMVDAPTADVVEVVRCKDCKWFSVHNKDGCYRPDLDHHAQMTPVYEDDFCSYGTPKERGGEK